MTEPANDGCGMTRRIALLISAATLVPSQLFSQERGSEEVLSAVRQAFSSMESTMNFAIEIPQEEVDSALSKFSAIELESRRYTAGLLRETGFAEDLEQVRSFIKSASQLVGEEQEYSLARIDAPAQQALLTALVDEDLPPVPSPEEMVANEIVTLPQSDGQGGQWHPDLIVVADILVDAMGIGLSPQEILVALIESDPEWEMRLQELVNTISTRDWRAVINAVQLIVLAIISPAVWMVITRALKEGGRTALFRLGLRLVPIVGPGYVAAVFLVSVKKNWNRFSFA